MRRLILLPLLGMVCLLAAGLTSAQAPKPTEKKFSAADLAFFEKYIRPALTEHCLKCHGQDPQKLRGGLDLTTREAILKGGDSGPSVIPGKPDESTLYLSIKSGDMPPDGKKGPSEKELQLIRDWIASGAKERRRPIRVRRIPNRTQYRTRGTRGWN